VPPRRIGFLVGTALIVLTLDVISKVCVVAFLEGHRPVRLLGGFLILLVTRNPGAAFSIGTSMTVVFTAIAIGVIVVILRNSRRIRAVPWAITLGLLLGGATGNLIDRIFRYPGPFRGYVVDWIELPHWPVFNLADSAIVCGGVLAVLLSARGTRLDGTRPAPESPAGPTGSEEPAPVAPDSFVSRNGSGPATQPPSAPPAGPGEGQAAADQSPGPASQGQGQGQGQRGQGQGETAGGG
jgi:signal peptidase II